MRSTTLLLLTAVSTLLGCILPARAELKTAEVGGIKLGMTPQEVDAVLAPKYGAEPMKIALRFADQCHAEKLVMANTGTDEKTRRELKNNPGKCILLMNYPNGDNTDIEKMPSYRMEFVEDWPANRGKVFLAGFRYATFVGTTDADHQAFQTALLEKFGTPRCSVFKFGRAEQVWTNDKTVRCDPVPLIDALPGYSHSDQIEAKVKLYPKIFPVISTGVWGLIDVADYPTWLVRTRAMEADTQKHATGTVPKF